MRRWVLTRLRYAVILYLTFAVLCGAALAEGPLIPVGEAVGIRVTIRGVLVADVTPVDTAEGTAASPAEAAGMKAGDVITAINGRAVQSAAELTEVQEGDNQMVKRLYGLDPAEYDGVLLYYPTTNMGAQELLLVKLKDVSQQEAVAAAVENRVTTQKNSFEGYGVEQFDMLERSITEVRGNYVLLIVAKDPDPVRAAFLAAL